MGGAHEHLEHAEHIAHAGHDGNLGRNIGVTMATMGVLLAFSSAMVGGERMEFVASMIARTNASGQYQSVSTKYRVVQAQLQAIGAEVDLSQTEAGVFLAKLPEGKHDFDLMRSTFADAQGLSRQPKTPGRWKHYGNAKLDPILDAADSTLDPEKRLEVLKHVQQIVLEDAAVIPLFSDSFLIAARKLNGKCQGPDAADIHENCENNLAGIF